MRSVLYFFAAHHLLFLTDDDFVLDVKHLMLQFSKSSPHWISSCVTILWILRNLFFTSVKPVVKISYSFFIIQAF